MNADFLMGATCPNLRLQGQVASIMNLVLMRPGIIHWGVFNWRMEHSSMQLEVEMCGRQNSKPSPIISWPLVYMPSIHNPLCYEYDNFYSQCQVMLHGTIGLKIRLPTWNRATVYHYEWEIFFISHWDFGVIYSSNIICQSLYDTPKNFHQAILRTHEQW